MKPAKLSTPSTLIERRMQALEQRDFSLIYDSYHDEAPFLKHFTDKSDYLVFAEQQLGVIVLAEWRNLGQRETRSGEVEVLVWMQMGKGTAAQDLFELALLINTASGWRYHSAQKLTREDYAGAVEDIDFCHFDQAEQKIRF